MVTCSPENVPECVFRYKQNINLLMNWLKCLTLTSSLTRALCNLLGHYGSARAYVLKALAKPFPLANPSLVNFGVIKALANVLASKRLG